MAYDERFADRIRKALASRKGITEREMFGGIGFLLDGKFVAGVHRSELMVRVPATEHDALTRQPGARTFEMTGRPPMKGWMLVDPKAVKTPAALKRWIDTSSEVAAAAKKKPMKKAAPKKATGARRAKR